MRSSSLSMVCGAVLSCAFFFNTARAQEQPAAGSPPPGAANQAPANSTATPPPAAIPAPAATATPGGYAQPGSAPFPQRGIQRQVQMLTRRLGLTPVQRSEVEPILTNRQRLIAGIRHDPTLVPWQKRVRVQKVFQDSDGEIEAILSGPQIQAYQQIVQQRLAHQRKMEQQQMDAPPVG